jgi:hypothetical protein
MKEYKITIKYDPKQVRKEFVQGVYEIFGQSSPSEEQLRHCQIKLTSSNRDAISGLQEFCLDMQGIEISVKSPSAYLDERQPARLNEEETRRFTLAPQKVYDRLRRDRLKQADALRSSMHQSAGGPTSS